MNKLSGKKRRASDLHDNMSNQDMVREKLRILYTSGITDINKLIKLTGLCQKTVYNCISKIKLNGSVKRKPGTGAKRKLKPADRQFLRRLGLKQDLFSNLKLATRLEEARQVKVSRFTIGRELKRLGLTRLAPNPVPLMTTLQQQRRLAWCLKYRNFDWSNAIFTDESRFQFFGNTRKLICKKGQRKFNPRPKHSPAIMCWGGLSARGRTPLATVKGMINSQVYCECLRVHLISTMDTLYPDGYVLQEDNATCHKSKYSQNWKKEHKIQCIDWPANSPDINPIENTWGLMKTILSGEKFKNVEQWKERIEEIWENFTDEYMLALVESMPGRLEAVIKNQGKVINY